MITVRLTEEIWEEACRGDRLLFRSDGPWVSRSLKAGNIETVSLRAGGGWRLDADDTTLFASSIYGREFTEWLKKNYPEELL